MTSTPPPEYRQKRMEKNEDDNDSHECRQVCSTKISMNKAMNGGLWRFNDQSSSISCKSPLTPPLPRYYQKKPPPIHSENSESHCYHSLPRFYDDSVFGEQIGMIFGSLEFVEALLTLSTSLSRKPGIGNLRMPLVYKSPAQ